MLRIINNYDDNLQKITLCKCEVVSVPKKMFFGQYLHSIFQSFPEIEKIYPPGILGFTLNGRRPNIFDELNDGDVVDFKIFMPSLNIQNSNYRRNN